MKLSVSTHGSPSGDNTKRPGKSTSIQPSASLTKIPKKQYSKVIHNPHLRKYTSMSSLHKYKNKPVTSPTDDTSIPQSSSTSLITADDVPYLYRVPRLSIAPMVDVTNVFWRLLNRLISHNTTQYTEMIVDKQLLNALPFSRVEIGIMHPTESNNFGFNMKRLYHEQEKKLHRNINTMLSLPSNQLPGQSIIQHQSSTALSSMEGTNSTPQSTPVAPSINPLVPIQYGGGSIAQISGADAFELAATAVLLQAMGYDGININMGCPASSAQNGLHGALMMITPGVETQLERLRSNPAIYVPISIKCRIGVNQPANYNWFKEWLFAYISQTGIAHYIVHSRIAKLNFNPRKNLNVPPLHPQYIHYLQNDVRHYIDGEKHKLLQIMQDYYEKFPSIDNDNNDSIKDNTSQSSKLPKPFGISGAHKNACMYYLDEATGKKCYVPLSICLEYNGGVIHTTQIAELSWALNENGGHVLRPNFISQTSSTDDDHKDDHNADPLVNNSVDELNEISEVDESTLQSWQKSQHFTRLHVPALSQHSPNNTEMTFNPESDFAWMKTKTHSKKKTLDEHLASESTPQVELKQPLLSGIMVGRGDMNDVFFPLFYDAFQHALVLASNGQLDSIPSLVSPQYERSIDNFVTNDIDPYDHTKLSLTHPSLLLSEQIGSNNEQINLSHTHSTDPDLILYNTLKNHMSTDPMQHHSGLYIDVRTGHWVNDLPKQEQKYISPNNPETDISLSENSLQTPHPQHKSIQDMTELEKIETITGFPSVDYNIPTSPSRLDILFHYLSEVDRLLFHPTHARDLQFQYELSIQNPISTKDDQLQTPQTPQNHHIGSPHISTNTPISSNHIQISAQQQSPSPQASFLDQSTPSMTPSESIELFDKHRLTPFDQQSLTTCIFNPLNRATSLFNQPYPYDETQSSCSFATTVKPLGNKPTKSLPDEATEATLGETQVHHEQNDDANDGDDDDDDDDDSGSTTKPHPFVEYIAKVLITQEINDTLSILDFIFYTFQKELLDQGALPGIKKLNKPQTFENMTELFKAIELCQEHPFLAKVSHKSALNKAIILGSSVDEIQKQMFQHDKNGYPDWITAMPDYPVLLKYRPLIDHLRTIVTSQYALIKQTNDQFQVAQLEKQGWESLFHGLKDFSTQLMNEQFDEVLQHKNWTSSNAKSRVSSHISRLTKISESQAIASAFYGYLYGASDLFLRPLTTLFANTEGNEQWRKIIHTACLLTRGNTEDIFNESYFWTHDNRYDANSNPKWKFHAQGRAKMILQNIEATDPDKNWKVHQQFPYIGTSSERYSLDRIDFSKSTIHQLLPENLTNTNPNADPTTTPQLIKQKYDIGLLQYDPMTMQLYPADILDQFADSNSVLLNNDFSATIDPDSDFSSALRDSESSNYSTNNNLNLQHHKLTEFGPNKLTMADYPKSARATGIIELNHPITKVPQNIVNIAYKKHLKNKSDEFHKSIEHYAHAYLQYNKPSFDVYLENTDNFMGSFYQHQRLRDEDTVQYIRQRKAEIARLKQEQTEIGNDVATQLSEADLRIQRLSSQKGGDYQHVDVTEEYVTKKQQILDTSSRRIHFAFLQRFPYDLSSISQSTLEQFLHYIGGDIELYKSSPFQQLGWDDQNDRHRRSDDVEYEQFLQRFSIESVSWLQTINSQQTSLSLSTSSSPSQLNQLPASTSTPNSPSDTSSSSHLSSKTTISSLLQPGSETLDVVEAMPYFAELCERHQTLISSRHSFQYFTQSRVNVHNAIAYLRSQLSLIDSLQIPDAIQQTLTPADYQEYRRSTLHFTVSRNLLRQPVLDFQTKYKLYQDAKNVLSAINGLGQFQSTTLFNPLNSAPKKSKPPKQIIPPTLSDTQ